MKVFFPRQSPLLISLLFGNTENQHSPSLPSLLQILSLSLSLSNSQTLNFSEDRICEQLLHQILAIVTKMVLPFVKLGSLVLKTACKPIASRLKKEASQHPRFRQFIVNFAQANHRFTTQMQRRIYGHRTDVEIRPLDEEKAVQAAADLIGELFVFSVAGVAVIYEVQRSAKSEARKEEARKQELEEMRQRDEELGREVEALKQKLEALEKLTKDQGLRSILNIGKPSQPTTQQHK